MTGDASIIRVIGADDHPLVQEGITAILANEPDIELLGMAGTGREAVELFRRLQPHVVLMDLRMPDLDGIEATRMILEETPAAKIIALTSYDTDNDIKRALQVGVRGYVNKTRAHWDIVRAIRAVHTGDTAIPRELASRLGHAPRSALTPRERQVLSLASRGLKNKEIANNLGITDGTVKMYLESIFGKLGAFDRTHAVTLAMELGILHLWHD